MWNPSSISRKGLNLSPSHCKVNFLTTGPLGKSSNCMFNLHSHWLFYHHLVFLYNRKCERRKCLRASPCRTGFMTCAFLTALNAVFAVLILLILPGQGAYIFILHWAPQIIELLRWPLPSSVSQISRKLELSEVGWNTKKTTLVWLRHSVDFCCVFSYLLNMAPLGNPDSSWEIVVGSLELQAIIPYAVL